MAIPLGTTSRQLETVLRWAFAGVFVVGMLCWWWPSYRAWGALAGGLLILWTLWVLWRTHMGDPTVPGHPIHLALLGPAAVLVFHVARGAGGAAEDANLEGALEMSMLWQLGLLAGGIVLSQSLMPRAAEHAGVLSVCGLAMTAGAVFALAWGRAAPVRDALAMVGFAGLCVWLLPLWGLPPRRSGPGAAFVGGRAARVGCAAVGAIGAAALVWTCPLQAAMAVACAGMAVLLAGIVFSRGRAVLLCVGGGLSIAAAAGGRALAPGLFDLRWAPRSALGEGQRAFIELSASDSGLAILARATGWFGLAWAAVGLLLCVVWLLSHARRGHAGDRARAVTWAAATFLCAAAVLAPAGPFVPVVLLAAMFCWGLLPAMLGRRSTRWSGWSAVVILFALMLLMGLARSGLLGWGFEAYGAGDAFLHAITGVLVAVMMAWMLGARRVWMGLLGLAGALLLGGVAELAQGTFSDRGMEWRDWVAHGVGVAAALPMYLLAVGARGCESAEAAMRRDDAYGPV